MAAKVLSLSKVNSVVIFTDPDSMSSHAQAIENLGTESGISVFYLSCKNPNRSTTASVIWVINRVLEIISLRTRVGCGNPMAWFKYRKDNAAFGLLVQHARKQATADNLNNFLAHNNSAIRKQIENLVEIEKRQFALVVIGDFQEIPREEQPVLAMMIHKLTKGAPAYFRILSTNEPLVFRKDGLGEVGIQRSHDYVEIRA